MRLPATLDRRSRHLVHKRNMLLFDHLYNSDDCSCPGGQPCAIAQALAEVERELIARSGTLPEADIPLPS